MIDPVQSVAALRRRLSQRRRASLVQDYLTVNKRMSLVFSTVAVLLVSFKTANYRLGLQDHDTA